MATLLDKKSIVRKLLCWERNKQLMIKVAPDGLYFKREGSRWSSAVFLPHRSAFDYACIRYAKIKKQEKAEARKRKRLSLASLDK